MNATNHIVNRLFRSAISLEAAILLLCFLSFRGGSLYANQFQETMTLEGVWLFEMNHKDIGYAQFYFDFEHEGNKFEAHSQKGRLKNILGPTKSFLARATSKSFKKGAILHLINGTITDDNKLEAIFVSSLGNFRLNGTIQEGVITGSLSRKGKIFGKMMGSYKGDYEVLENYNLIIDSALASTNQYICNPSLLEQKAYRKFKKKLTKFGDDCVDDIELIFAFYYFKRKLPFSHYFLFRPAVDKESISLDEVETEKDDNKVTLENKEHDIAILRIESFDIEPERLDSIFNILKKGKSKHLIIDLRNNPGGNIAGLKVISNIINKPIYGGVFLTNKWFKEHSTPPAVAEYESFPVLSEANLSLLWDGIHNEKGLVIKAIPEKERYEGEVWALVNGSTASTCEPIVYSLKQHKLGTVVGTTTAGAMLNGEQFNLEHGWSITIPTADYYTSDGYHIDQKGVEPDIVVKDNALQYVIQSITRQN